MSFEERVTRHALRDAINRVSQALYHSPAVLGDGRVLVDDDAFAEIVKAMPSALRKAAVDFVKTVDAEQIREERLARLEKVIAPIRDFLGGQPTPEESRASLRKIRAFLDEEPTPQDGRRRPLAK